MIETFLFGGSKGIGESILIRIEEETYMIIDSFIDTETGNPRILDFLEEKDIELKCIKYIVLTHCHKDHFTGMSILVEQCTDAIFFTSRALGIESFRMLLVAYSKKVKSSHNYFKELIDTFKILKNTGRKVQLLSDTSKPIFSKKGISIQAFSPNTATEKCLQPIYEKETRKFLTENGIRLLTNGFNYQSVVISLECENYKMLFGADQEFHKSDSTIGWDAIEQLPHFEQLKFDFFKVPHHGSENGYKFSFWEKILTKDANLMTSTYS